MKDMKSFLICFLLCFIASVPLVAKDFVVTGYGASIKEAREDALEALSLSISSSVSTLVMSATYDDGEAVSQRYGDSSLQSSDFDPVGMEFGQPQRNDGMWSIKVTLPSSSAHLYYDRLEEKAVEIERLYDAMGNLSNLDEVSYDELDQLSELLASFEVDRLVATGLDRNGTVPELPVSRSQVEVQRNAKIQAEEDSLEGMLDTYGVAEALGLLTDEMEADRQELSRRLDELRADNQARIEEMDARTRDLLEELGAVDTTEIQEGAAENEDTSQIVDSLDELVLRLSNLEAVRASVSQSIRELNKDYTEEVHSFIEEAMAREWPSVTLGIDGKPTDVAIKERREGFDYAAVSQFAPSYAASMSGQMDMALELMTGGIGNIAEMAQELINSNFTLSSEGSILSVSIDGARGGAFVGTMHIRLAGRDINIDFSIPFESWMSEPMPDSATQIFEYEDYLFVVSQWLSMLMDNSGLLRLDLKCSIAYDPIEYCIYFTPDSYTVKRLDTDKIVLEQEISSDGETRYDLLLTLPFDLEKTTFNFSFGTIDPDLIQAGFDVQGMIDEAIADSDLARKVDITNLGLARMSGSVVDELNGLPLQDRIAITSGEVESIGRQLDQAEEREKNARSKTERLDRFFEAPLFLEPYVSGAGTFGIFDGSDGRSMTRGEFSLGLAAYLNLTDETMNMYMGVNADLSYTYASETLSDVNGTVDRRIQAIGGSINADFLVFKRLPSFAIKGEVRTGFGWYPDFEVLTGLTGGVLIPVGDGLLDLSAKLLLSVPLDKSSDISSIQAPINLSVGLIAGYAFSL